MTRSIAHHPQFCDQAVIGISNGFGTSPIKLNDQRQLRCYWKSNLSRIVIFSFLLVIRSHCCYCSLKALNYDIELVLHFSTLRLSHRCCFKLMYNFSWSVFVLKFPDVRIPTLGASNHTIHIGVKAFSQTDLFLVGVYLEFSTRAQKRQWHIRSTRIVF